MSWVWLAAAIGCEIAATLGLRASDGLRRKRWLGLVGGGYTLAFGCLALTLRAGMPVGVAYGIWSATGVALVALLAHAIWQDPLTRRMGLGLLLVAAGVLLVELGSAH